MFSSWFVAILTVFIAKISDDLTSCNFCARIFAQYVQPIRRMFTLLLRAVICQVIGDRYGRET